MADEPNLGAASDNSELPSSKAQLTFLQQLIGAVKYLKGLICG